MRALITLFALVPLFAFAQANSAAELDELLRQLADLQTKVEIAKATNATANTNTATTNSTTQPVTLSCPSFTRTLQKGSEGADVRALQEILKSGGYLTVEPTGYFGALTEKALQDFQKKVGIVSSGSPATTGWGTFGPKTRTFVLSLCGGAQTTTTTVGMCPAAPIAPSETCVGTWQRTYGANNCHTGWQCVPASAGAGNGSPSLLRLDGPTSLSAGSLGTWTIQASDPEGGALKYSVIWGDEIAGSVLSLLAGVDPPILSSSSRISHVYAQPGNFFLGVTVHDAAGNMTSGRFPIAVAASPFKISTSTTITTVAPPPNGCVFANVGYAEGTETEGYNVTDLCLATNGTCLQRSAYVPKFKCDAGIWKEQLTNPYPNLPSYANSVGSRCGSPGTTSRGATMQSVVSPGNLMCRGSLCATVQNFAPITLTCEYEIWVDWGAFSAGATTSTMCANPMPCEYAFGSGGRACAARQNGACPTPGPGIGR